MKISKTKLRQIIKEEVSYLREEDDWDQTVKTEPVEDKYTESQRLFDHFFGDWEEEALDYQMSHDVDLEDIVTQLAGWLLPNYKHRYDEPGQATVDMAQEFEKENKSIEGNEDEFLDRLQDREFKKAKEMFAQTQIDAPHMRAKNVKASPAHIQKALGAKVRGKPSGYTGTDIRGVVPTRFVPRVFDPKKYRK